MSTLNHSSHVAYLLIGGGLTSSSAAAAIRKIDSKGSLMIVGQEINRPYHRPPLSKEFLRREKTHEELFTQPADWFAQNTVQLRTGRRVVALDTARHRATLDSGQEIGFGKALIATGGQPRRLDVPGANLPNTFYLRSLDDIDRLHHAIDQAKTAGRTHIKGRGKVVVIGGGFLGVELAASLTQMGLGVDLIAGDSYPWAKFAGETVGRSVSRFLSTHGITVHESARATALDGDGRVQRVILSNGATLPCDFVIAAVGMTANKELLRGTPISGEKAILTDQTCRTNVPEIYAAGDCAAIFDPLFGKHRLIDHWDHAIASGTLAGTNMASPTPVARYNTVSTFFSDVFDLSLNAWGEARFVDRRLIRGTPNGDTPRFTEIGVAADGRIAQVIALGNVLEAELLPELVRRRLPVNGNAEKLKDPAVSVQSILADPT